MVAKNGMTFAISVISELNNDGKIPIIKIRDIPNGSINALGISGRVSPFQIDETEFLPIVLNCFEKKLSELVNFISIIELRDSLIMLFDANSTSNRFFVANLI